MPLAHRLPRRAGPIVNLVTAAAVAAAAISAGPAPAVAGGKDVARGAALIALLAVGAALVQQDRTARAAAPAAPALPPQPLYAAPRDYDAPQRSAAVTRSPRPVANPGWRDPGWQDPGRQDPGRQDSGRQDSGWSPAPARDDSRAPRIPAVCAVEIDGRQPATIYADSCLAREGFDFALPAQCAQTIRSRDWSGRIYDGACLRDAGFRTDRRW